mmetsp:Transcript_55511/g.88121  ORF Transcript_55511/g.88121 Transcript_55511/m.88121 type:complete len:222 (+) Transcript_55511:216-881(+)
MLCTADMRPPAVPTSIRATQRRLLRLCRQCRLSAQRRISVVGPITPCRAGQTILKEHTDNGHHCQTSVCKFSIQLGFLCHGVRDLAQEGRKSNAIVARSSRHGGILHEAQAILSGEESRSLNQANEPQDLVPAKRWNFRDRRKTTGHITELQTKRRAQVTWKFVVFWDDIANCREHCYPAVLDLNCSASSECGSICVGVQSKGIPVPEGCLHTKVSGGDGC